MAQPISFKPQPVDPHQELMRRLDAAPREHAEALLGAWDLLQTAHDQGILDLVHGLIGGRDIIAGKLAEATVQPETIAILRNLIAAGRILGSFDPDVLHRMSKNMAEAAEPQEAKEARRAQAQPPGTRLELAQITTKPQSKTPSLWQIFKQFSSEDGRRGLAFAAASVTSLGRATRSKSPQ